MEEKGGLILSIGLKVNLIQDMGAPKNLSYEKTYRKNEVTIEITTHVTNLNISSHISVRQKPLAQFIT